MRVCLNGMNFELLAETGVTRSPLAEWADQIRTDGNQQRKDRVFISSWSIDDWSGGLGVENIKTGSTPNLKRVWDAENVDTRFDQIVLSPQFNTCTIVPSRGDLELSFDYLNNLYFAETKRAYAVATAEISNAYKFTPPFSIGSQNRVAKNYYFDDSSFVRAGSLCAVRAFGEKLALIAYNSGSIAGKAPCTQYFTIGALGATLSGGIILGGDRVALPQIGDFNGTIHVLYPIANWNKLFVGNTNLAVPSQPTATLPNVVGSYTAPFITDGLTMYNLMPDGLWNTKNPPDKAVDTITSREMNPVSAMHLGNVFFKNGKSTIQYDGINLTDVGYNRNDGLPSDKSGETTAMCSTWKYLFAAVKGGTYSHILSYYGNAWQYYARVPSPGLWVRDMFMSNSPDTIERLWVVYGNYGYPGYFLNPLTNPLQAATYAYVPTGHVAFPAYGGDMPEESGAYFRQKYNLGGMGGSNILTAQYGLNGDTPVTTLGVVATNEYPHTFGSPYGVESSKIMPKYILAGANSGTTPIFKQAVIEYLKDPDKRSIFDFTVDIDATSQFGRTSKEAVIGSLNFALDKKTMMPFWYGQMGTRHVKALDMPFNEDVKIQNPLEQQREGLVQVRLVEVL